ncbi:hypothetical protein [Pseudomonas phage vB_PaeM_PAO1_Ab03]|uniref:Uncharacterized protein n=1 Tax=Pseudomonas phage vB_PaeM_PAO1_Ab03 TaxID=1548901 RepID=A0A0A1IU64_9CAUD|nr:hypothetical protein VC54_gp038 [Pseudomonas phage vB_PaeM_PAO1_Ab03]CEF89143.1 hypothetical protein [Pseudomonas phage vB_PaeM_PAO1_Ab03]
MKQVNFEEAISNLERGISVVLYLKGVEGFDDDLIYRTYLFKGGFGHVKDSYSDGTAMTALLPLEGSERMGSVLKDCLVWDLSSAHSVSYNGV